MGWAMTRAIRRMRRRAAEVQLDAIHDSVDGPQEVLGLAVEWGMWVGNSPEGEFEGRSGPLGLTS
jgi:hypothetical protein